MWILLFLCATACSWPQCCARDFDEVEARGRAELRRLQGFAAQPVYGACWSRALERIRARCRQFTEETQSRVALAFTHCHLRRSNRPFPECMDDSNVKECTQDMDPVAFITYTEFFTHVHSICHFLESEHWQHRAEGTIHRLTESSAGVAEQLASTQRMAEDLVQAQRVALKSQEAILRNGEELKFTLHDSTQGLKDVFADLQHTAQEQQLAFSEIFGRIAFLQNFVMSESHTLGSLLYNTLGLCIAFLLTATKLLMQDCHIVADCQFVPRQERIDQLVALLRRGMVFLGLLVLIYVGVRFRDVSRESLEILTQLKESHSSLQLALQKAGDPPLPPTVLETSGRLGQPQSSRSRERPPTALTYSVLVNDSQVSAQPNRPNNMTSRFLATKVSIYNPVLNPIPRHQTPYANRRQKPSGLHACTQHLVSLVMCYGRVCLINSNLCSLYNLN
uniref:Uncharacterized LOC111856156 n=1 Tax=Paramormyrops kingsleyae TaxID=1676925 RepID=A0A3B3QP78_9TELE